MKEHKKTLVMGASENPERYCNQAILKLRYYGHEVVAIGKKNGQVKDVVIETGKPPFQDIDTVSLYLSQKNQEEYHEYIISLAPKRVIFNPGAENDQLFQLCEKHQIEATEACTLVLLSIGAY